MIREKGMRVYDPVAKEMSYDLILNTNGRINYINKNGEEVELGPGEGNLMFATGRLDINQKMVYEGDNVEYDAENDGIWETYTSTTIVYDTTYAMFCLEWDAPNLLDHYKNFKIVGNIYEGNF